MKRKFKLFATLASLCLSVALMAFGVYAATNVTYHVTSTVSFDAQVAGTFAWKIAGGVMEKEYTDEPEDPTEHEAWAALAGRTGSEEALVGNEIHTNGAFAVTRDLANVKFNPAENKNEIVYYISFTNSSDQNAYVSVAFAKLFDISGAAPAVDQLDVYVGHAVNADADDAETAALTAAAASQYTGAATLASAAQARETLASGATYVLAVKVVLLNATAQLTSSNEALDLTMSVTSI